MKITDYITIRFLQEDEKQKYSIHSFAIEDSDSIDDMIPFSKRESDTEEPITMFRKEKIEERVMFLDHKIELDEQTKDIAIGLGFGTGKVNGSFFFVDDLGIMLDTDSEDYKHDLEIRLKLFLYLSNGLFKDFFKSNAIDIRLYSLFFVDMLNDLYMERLNVDKNVIKFPT